MRSLWTALVDAQGVPAASLIGRDRTVPIGDLTTHSFLPVDIAQMTDRSVLFYTSDHLLTAATAMQLDGIARRITLATADLTSEQLLSVVKTAEAQLVIFDTQLLSELPVATIKLLEKLAPQVNLPTTQKNIDTEWVLLTSGTSGLPKLVSHSVESLAGGLPARRDHTEVVIWSTFYDVRRYGGLQILLRALISQTPLVLTSPHEPTHSFLSRVSTHQVTHISGTPSHWRGVLMTGQARVISPHYIRLSGEIADQSILDHLKATFPKAAISHAFASTEAGVGFEVTDGLAGFPMEYVNDPHRPVELRVVDGTLRIKSQRNARHYLGQDTEAIIGADSFVDTGDLVELLDGRYHFRGRKTGVINIGGLKVHPEEVEALLNKDPRVHLSLVYSRKSPIVGALVAADVVLKDSSQYSPTDELAIKDELLARCRDTLAPHKVPAVMRFVPQLAVNPTGKLVRPHA